MPDVSTPDELRMLVSRIKNIRCGLAAPLPTGNPYCPSLFVEEERLLDVADVWEKSIKYQLDDKVVMRNEIDVLQARIEALEEEREAVLDVVDDDVWPVGTNSIRRRIIAALAGKE